MAYWGNSFIFDGTPSERYGLLISSPDGGGLVETTGAGDVEILTQKVFRNPKPYLLGVEQSPVLTFDVNFTSENELMVDDIRVIQSWLFGQQQYKKLQIVQFDMQKIYFNCFITSPRVIKTGNIINGVAGTVVCDSPFAWEFPKTHTLNNVGGIADVDFDFNNTSDNSFYEFPALNIVMGDFGATFKLTNNSDMAREFEFIELSAFEELTVDNERCIITSSTGLRRMSKFNKKWFRMIKGLNNLNAYGNFETLRITYSPARKVG